MTYSGINPKDPNSYVGPKSGLVPAVTRSRLPTTADYRQPETGKNYPITCIWQVGKNPTTGSEGDLYALSKIVGNQATWVKLGLGGGTDGIVSITGDNGTSVLGDGAGNVDLDGTVVANAANAKPVYVLGTEADPIHELDVQVQVATTVSPTPANTNSVGLACFNSNQFQIDATSGMVSFKGSTTQPALILIQLDDTQSATADNSGVITLGGTIVAQGTNATTLFSKRTPGTNDIDLQLQLATTSTYAARAITKNGVAHFNSAQFQNDAATGIVSLIGSTSVPPILTLQGSDGGGPISGDANGNILLQSAGGATITGAGNTITITAGGSSGITWREEVGTSATFATGGEGIFANNAGTVTLTLPATASVGDAFAAYQEGAGKVRIAQNASDRIRFGNQLSTAGVGGYIESLNQGDCVTIVAIDTDRFRVISSEGSWSVV